MNLTSLSGVKKQFGARVLFENVDLKINRGDRIGLIGVNGGGKSTLLKIIAGLEVPDEGDVLVWENVSRRYLEQSAELAGRLTALDAMFEGPSPRMRLLKSYRAAMLQVSLNAEDQHAVGALDRLSERMTREDGWAVESNARSILGRLGIHEFEKPLDEMSGGQQKRVALAQALLDPPDLLILDEPTNHLDAETIAAMESLLAELDGGLIMVTHDRYFLDRVVNRIIELDRRIIQVYGGAYSDYLDQSAKRHTRLRKQEEDRERQLKKELDWLRRGAKARSTKQKARKDRIETLKTLRYDSREDRVRLVLGSRRLGKKVLEAERLSKSYGEVKVLDGLSLRLEPGDRIGIVGPNGAGKSTLLDILAGRLPADEGKSIWGETVQLAYFDQRSIELPDDQKVIDYTKDGAPLIPTRDGRMLSAAEMLEWFLFPPEAQHAWIGSLSGGEKRRLYLLRLLIEQPNVLLLDEPTNDFDIQTLRVLEDFIEGFQGSVVVASHDRYFLDRTVDQIHALEAGRLSGGYPVPFERFLALRAKDAEPGDRSMSRTGTRTSPSASSKSQKPASRPESRPARLSYKDRRALESLRSEIAGIEAEIAEMHRRVQGAAGDHQALNEAAKLLAAREALLEDKMEEWLRLEELAGE